MEETGSLFRFESLQIWQRAADLNMRLFDIADQLDELRKYRFAEQLRSAALSITNNIAEGSGSDSNKDFQNFLRIARRSVFECANMLTVFGRHRIIASTDTQPLLQELSEISRMITAFRNRLNHS